MKARLVLLCLLAAIASTAVAGAVPAQASARQGAAVPYVSGGVGADSLEALKAREKEFNLKLVFTLVEGNYLAGVNVSIKDRTGKTLLESVADGPVFMVRLPPGDYAVSATYEGKTQTRNVEAGKGLRTEYLRWASRPGADFPLPPETKEQQPTKH